MAYRPLNARQSLEQALALDERVEQAHVLDRLTVPALGGKPLARARPPHSEEEIQCRGKADKHLEVTGVVRRAGTRNEKVAVIEQGGCCPAPALELDPARTAVESGRLDIPEPVTNLAAGPYQRSVRSQHRSNRRECGDQSLVLVARAGKSGQQPVQLPLLFRGRHTGGSDAGTFPIRTPSSPLRSPRSKLRAK